MARIRSIWPAICSSEDMATLPANLERTYVRLWTHCDDEGRAVDNPRLIKAALYPLNDEQTWEVVDAELAELERHKFIARYEVAGVRYLAVLAWDKYQKPQKKVASKIPPLPEEYASPIAPLPDASANGKAPDLGDGKGSRKREVGVAPKSARIDPIFEAVCQIASIDWHELTDTGRAPVAKAASELRKVKANPDEVRIRAVNYALRFEDQPTPMALAKHWAQCAHPPPNLDRKTLRGQLDRYQLGSFLDLWSQTT